MNNEIIYDLTDWIEENLASKLTLDKVADKAGYSKWHLQRMYHKMTGITLSRYIRNRKLSAAAVELLLTKVEYLSS